MVVACATCSKKIRLYKDSRPEGEAQCRACLNQAFANSGGRKRTRPCGGCGKKVRADHCGPCSRRDQHILTGVDTEAGTGLCSQCGDTRVKWHGRGLRCVTVIRAGEATSLQRRTEVKRKFRERMLDKQDHRCAICGLTINDFGGKDAHSARIDHDHTSGFVRDALCNGCNMGLGGFRESPAALRAAAAYLERHASSPSGVLYWDYSRGRLGIRLRASTVLT